MAMFLFLSLQKAPRHIKEVFKSSNGLEIKQKFMMSRNKTTVHDECCKLNIIICIN